VAKRGSGNFWGGDWDGGGGPRVMLREVSEAFACEKEADAAQGFEG
jgi:hypothetical protein